MKRRGFLKSLLGVAALAAHAKFGSLVPIAEPEPTTTLDVRHSSCFHVGETVWVAGEVMLITGVGSGSVTVQRGLGELDGAIVDGGRFGLDVVPGMASVYPE